MTKTRRPKQQLTNIIATKILKSMFTQNESNPDNPKMGHSALSVYDSITEPRDYIVINAMIKMFHHFKNPEKVISIWKDLQSLSLLQKSKLHFSFLMKCCIHSPSIPISKCLQVMEWMTECQYRLQIHESWIIKLVMKCDSDLSALYKVHSFLDFHTRSMSSSSILAKTVFINSYGRCGAVDAAKQIFESIPDALKDAKCITAMMKCFSINHHYDDAITLYEKYDSLNDHVSHLCALECCTQSGNIPKVRKIHSRLRLNDDSMSDLKLKSALIEFYGHCGDIKSAQQIYHSTSESIRNSNVVLSSSMMNALITNDMQRDALRLYQYQNMKSKDAFCHILALKACLHLNDVKRGRAVIDECRNTNSQISDDIHLQTAMIEFYAHFTIITSAVEMFKSIPNEIRRVSTCNAMMRGYINIKSYSDALRLYHDHIEDLTLKPTPRRRDDISHILASIALVGRDELETGLEYLEKTKCFQNARNIDIHKILDILSLMTSFPEDIYQVPPSFLVNAVSKCGCNVALLRKTHLLIQRLLDSKVYSVRDEMVIKTSLINAYGKPECGQIGDAINVFDGIRDDIKDAVCVGAMMKVLLQNGKYHDVLRLYDDYSLLNDDVSHLLALQSCSELGDLEKGKAIHQSIETQNGKKGGKSSKSGNSSNTQVRNALMHLYGKCGDVENAVSIFKTIPDNKQDVVSIGSMLNALCKSDRNKECIEMFNAMKRVYGIEPNLICYAIVLTACTNSTAFHFGQQIHRKLANDAHLKWMLNDAEIQSPLISMYGKCGKLETAESIFEEIKRKESVKYKSNISIWNAMIHAFGRNGKVDRAKKLYHDAIATVGLKADVQTYLLMINACSHSGDLDEARKIWQNVPEEGIKYDGQLTTTLIDCLSRKGYLDEAHRIIEEYEERTNRPYHAMWSALLFGCSKYENMEFAERVYDAMQHRFRKDDQRMASATVLMSNIYVGAGQIEKANAMRKEMKLRGIKKEAAISEIDVHGELHRFYANDRQRDKEVDEALYEMRERLKREFGYEPDLKCITRELGKGESGEDVLLMHSEKIALIYGLMHTAKEYDIVINKNLRICKDCHNFIKFVSKVEDRRITVADANRVHIFHDGQCSCNEYY